MGTPNNLGFLAIIKINSGIAGRRSDALPGVRASPDKLVPAGIEEIRAALRGTGDLILAKPRLGAFHGTELEIILRAASIDTLLIGGIATNMCVETTAREAAVRDFRVLFLRDGTATFALPDAVWGRRARPKSSGSPATPSRSASGKSSTSRTSSSAWNQQHRSPPQALVQWRQRATSDS